MSNPTEKTRRAPAQYTLDLAARRKPAPAPPAPEQSTPASAPSPVSQMTDEEWRQYTHVTLLSEGHRIRERIWNLFSHTNCWDADEMGNAIAALECVDELLDQLGAPQPDTKNPNY